MLARMERDEEHAFNITMQKPDEGIQSCVAIKMLKNVTLPL